MSSNDSELQAQARKILDAICLQQRFAIAFIPFEQCQSLTREFDIFQLALAFMQLGTELMDYLHR
jgi:hypothetical protein